MGFSNFAYEKYFGPNFSRITKCDFPQLNHGSNRKFVQEYFLKSVFFQECDSHKKPVVYYLLRRVQQVVDFYDKARTSFLELSNRNEDRIEPYLESLNYLEIVIMLTYQCFNLVKSQGTKLFEKDDSTPLQRLNRCYNQIKHLEHVQFNTDTVQSTYLDIDRFCTSDSFVTYFELKDLIDKLINSADNLLK